MSDAHSFKHMAAVMHRIRSVESLGKACTASCVSKSENERDLIVGKVLHIMEAFTRSHNFWPEDSSGLIASGKD